MNIIKTNFTIKDLENLSGIKAHTIRIWEKRYQLLKPQRTSGNARYYDTENLQKLLNVVLLNKNGYKISKISELSEDSIILIARELASKHALVDDAINSFKIAMFNFDQYLFHKVYNQLLINKTFREVFKEVFVPFLNHIGVLWQTKTLTPAHEHFISNLIAQKIQINIERIQQQIESDTSSVYVLFLPENEIHELGLLYLNYELLLRGKQTIYLGQSIPLNNLDSLLKKFDKIQFISSFTVAPLEDHILDYMKEIEGFIKNTNHSFCAFGIRTASVQKTTFQGDFVFYNGLLDLLKEL
ncbi:MAG: MerR family transcriptional regulator [Flavobacteriaceae bacterium]|nr:MerR family transcriptional regulator [Flavobacteriaceae bacterium]